MPKHLMKVCYQLFLITKNEPPREKTGFLHMRKQMQISFAVTAKLISTFVFTSTIPLLSKYEISNL